MVVLHAVTTDRKALRERTEKLFSWLSFFCSTQIQFRVLVLPRSARIRRAAGGDLSRISISLAAATRSSDADQDAEIRIDIRFVVIYTFLEIGIKFLCFCSRGAWMDDRVAPQRRLQDLEGFDGVETGLYRRHGCHIIVIL
ncbi:uncharacterized protein LOC113461004 [Phoenix dactylifera]|uniref:Uncharacterized protein LOC113461004 n=1 Tax=Phoenix dactylifera TaxID=42345 RepID=A0A8B8ZW90_PHODC|nr:uncharacterized protein LOC113461004 [Phoenix dactylifera]